jgi:hypothetical protein
MPKSARKIVREAYSALEELGPTPEEIRAYAACLERKHETYGVVTYSESHGRGGSFLRFHDAWGVKRGGRIHIDVGYVDEECVGQRGVPDTTHLMLDKTHAPAFVQFIKQRRKDKPQQAKNP